MAVCLVKRNDEQEGDKMDNIKIGYQGEENSNNNRAAQIMADKVEIFKKKNIELIPLLSSENVIKALKDNKIDYGVMAFSTDAWGEVKETKVACENVMLKKISSVNIDIHHCIFKKNDNIHLKDINVIASHIEAIKECSKYIASNFKNIELYAADDTASAAKKLSKGLFTDRTAVICSIEAGMKNGLTLIDENIEDLEHNGTLFIMVKLL